MRALTSRHLYFAGYDGCAHRIIDFQVSGVTGRTAYQMKQKWCKAQGSLRIVIEQREHKIRQLPVEFTMVIVAKPPSIVCYGRKLSFWLWWSDRQDLLQPLCQWQVCIARIG